MTVNKIDRINFSITKKQFDYPDFLEIQIKSFQEFFQLDSTAEQRKNEGLYGVFQEIFPITDTRNSFILEFVDYSVEHPRYTIEQCIERGLTYSVPLKVRLKLSCTDIEHEDFETTIQEVWFGQIPYMTPSGTFVINGAERVIVSQLHRSPGVFFSKTTNPTGTGKLYSARIIPFKGSWIEFATDSNSVLYAYLDRKKKSPITTLLRAIGFETDKDVLGIFDLTEEVKVSRAGLKKFVGQNRKLAARVMKTWFEDFVDEDTAEVNLVPRHEVLIDIGTTLENQHIDIILEAGVDTILLHKKDGNQNEFEILFNTLKIDTCNNEKEAITYIYHQIRGTEPPDEATARDVVDKLLFSDKRYDLGDVGRYKLNKKLNLNISPSIKVLTKEDIIAIIKYLIDMVNNKAEEDDIDHLNNRRVRTVGEQLANLFSVGFARMSRTIKERMNIRDTEVFKPADLINAKTLASVLNTFFGTNQLSQFMDQINPLAEITHKRRLSALGPGGLSRERAGFEVRDVHYTHYGRLCPIETPEGPNIGLISSLCVYSRINHLGFIETPYRAVKSQHVLFNEIKYFGAEKEDEHRIAQANAKVDDDGLFSSTRGVKARDKGDFVVIPSDDITLMDVAPNQIASISASLIPFLEHDDANRALMGSNMMRQAVPLLKPEAPIVGTGIEHFVARDSRNLIFAEGDGIVEYVDAQEIKIKYTRTEEEKYISFVDDVKTYVIPKFKKTNQNSCINLRPIVKKGEKVFKGKILTDGYATEKGELALGRNLKVAFMPWKGYNFEDAIVLNERIVKEDVFTSIHISDYQLEIRDTKRGMEELTADIPNVSEAATKDLDANGIIRIGARVNPGDIMIGKITPKGESDPSPEEKLLRAIFGDKASDTKDASLKASPSINGVVIDKKLFAKAIKDKRTKNIDADKLAQEEAEYREKSEILKNVLFEKLFTIVNGKTSQGIKDIFGNDVIPKGVKFSQKVFKDVDFNIVSYNKWTTDKSKNDIIHKILFNYMIEQKKLDADFRRKKNDIAVGDELPSGIVQLAKVYLASKRTIRVGDKLAGRHGNKGILSRIVRQEDMPFLEDGTPVDIVLNPLGVPSRMNLGQIYETVLGWAGQELDCKFATPIFDGATIEQINEYTDKAGVPKYGQVYLYDGGTGERFDQPATVGIIYMLKLGHMVEDKMHARSIGPYSLITQQPLGGKAQFGGQRFGEMEVWALEAFGAANILQEILTVKSDDVVGRAKTYESIVKGDSDPERGLPESFNVLLYELRGLCLRIDLE